jgi:hypothetical protein
MKTTTSYPLLLASIAMASAIGVTAVGCNKNSDLRPLHGKVLLDGTPLTSGTISFVPEQGRSSTAKIGPDGTFELQTFGGNDGARPGKYRVAIVAFDGPQVEDRPVNSLIPQHYGNPAPSGLEFEVTADAGSEAKFELSSKAKPKK